MVENQQEAHGGKEFEELAINNEIFRCQVGSGLHGVTTGDDDRDEMGICIPPPDYALGLKKFDQFIYRTQPEGVRSGKGDLDLVIYSLKKWIRLAAAGNPTVMMLLYVPESEIVLETRTYSDLRERRDMFLSKDVAARFIGYMNSQRAQLVGEKSKKHTNRPELVDKYGFDTKFAYHMVRLGVQGLELLTTGNITLPMPKFWRDWLLDLRVGKHTKEECLEVADHLLEALRRVEKTNVLPNKADYNQINDWLIDTYQKHWKAKGLL